MKHLARGLVVTFVVAGLALVGSPATAGIIITSGKTAQGDPDSLANDGTSSTAMSTSGRRSSGSSSSTGALAGGKCDNGQIPDTTTLDHQSSDETDDGGNLDEEFLSDLDDPPEGWVCTDIGGGVQYCEPEEGEAQGAGPGVGAGGGLGTDATDGSAGETAGCAAGGVAHGLLWLFALLPLGWVRRRQG